MSPAWFACREPRHDDILPEQEVTRSLSQGVEAAAASGQSTAMCHTAHGAQVVHHPGRVCRHAQALDPVPAASVTHMGRWPYPCWGNGIENKPAVKQNCLVTQSCLTHSDPMDCSPPGFSVHGILQARILESVAMPSSRRSSPPRERPRKVGKDTALLWNQPEARMGNYGLTTSLSEVTEAGGAGRARGRLGPALCAAELTPELLPGPR